MTSDAALNAALHRVENDRLEITCPVSDVILMIAGLRMAITNPTLAPLDAARRLEHIVDHLTGILLDAEPTLEAMFFQ